MNIILLMCNYYNFSSSVPVDAKIIVAQEAPKEFTENYMVDVNRIVAKGASCAGCAVAATSELAGGPVLPGL